MQIFSGKSVACNKAAEMDYTCGAAPFKPDENMRQERHYTEAEIAAIFEKATEVQKAARSGQSSGEGLTLAELQQIGASVGLDPEFVAQAAAAVEYGGRTAPRRSMIGVPIGVGYEVDLPAPLSDDAWERLVAETRETFGARGKVSRYGSLRQWNNGNLQVSVEPAAGGQRLRMRTTSADLRTRLSLSGAILAAMLVFMFVLSLHGEPFSAIMAMCTAFSSFAAILFGTSFKKGKRWSARRERQMEALGLRAVELAQPSEQALSPGQALPAADSEIRFEMERHEHETYDAVAMKRRVRG